MYGTLRATATTTFLTGVFVYNVDVNHCYDLLHRSVCMGR